MSKEKEKPTPAEVPVMKTVEDWQKERGTADWVFIAARFCSDWPKEKMISDSEYDAAVNRVLDIKAQ